ncbi:MAG: hypothetical protein WAU01_09160 [Saprospiraceae bacterium]
MATKIFAQVILKPNKKGSINTSEKKKNIDGAVHTPSKIQLKRAEKKLLEAGCEITSLGPTIGIAMEVSEFDNLFGTKLGKDMEDPKVSSEVIIPEKLKDIIAEVAIATLPDYY